MNILLIANGEIKDYEYIAKHYIDGYDTVYCCDGGITHAEKLGVIPNVIIGDLDSASEAVLGLYKNSRTEIIKFPEEKDYTDTELGLRKAVEDGAKNVTILGGIGSRFDHNLANAHILRYALENDVNARLVDEHNEIVLINKEIQISGKRGDIISLLPFTTEAIGVTITGVKFPLYDVTLTVGSSFSVSNEMLGDSATISLKSGLIFVMKTRD